MDSHVIKGRRTKRPRNVPAIVAAQPSSSSSEDEDMANCLMLLAQGPPPNAVIKEKITSRGIATDDKSRFFVYECKTCNKVFPTFQALGGHRTSHKKPKLAIQVVHERKTGEIEQNLMQLSMNSSLNLDKDRVTKVHECLKCGSEFSSGQALGGHMRRHRQTSVAEHVEVKEEKKNFVMSLDLNLPASDDDCSCGELPTSSSPAAAAVTFSFASKPPLLLPTSAIAI